MTRRILISASAVMSLLLGRCGDLKPSWIPPGYVWEMFETVDGRSLPIAWPASLDVGGVRPLAVLVHGGGWTGGRPDEMLPVAELIHELGYQPVLVRYRRLGEVFSLDDSVADLRAAWRHIAARAEAIGGTVEGSVAIGGSAGGHPAHWAFGSTSSGPQPPGSLLLLCPVLDTSPETGFGADRLGEDWRRWSPRHASIRFEGVVLVLHGSDDAVIGMDATRVAVKEMAAAGSEVSLTVIEGLPHGFYTRTEELALAWGPIRTWGTLKTSP